MRRICLNVMVATIAITAFSISDPLVANSIRIIDGDTVELNGTTYRLNGIDAPEHGQKCEKQNGELWQCGKAATNYLKEIATKHQITCQGSASDTYGRIIGTCFISGLDLNELLVYNGMARAFLKYDKIYASAETLAATAKVGIWQGNHLAPWEFRAQRWNNAAQQAPAGCPIKGNISRNGYIYHAPWSPWYKRTKINEAKGERWFCNEAEALAAGWRAPLWGG